MARLHDLVVDSAHPAATARFWAAALDDYAIAPYDEAELARLRGLGIAGPEDDPTVLTRHDKNTVLADPEGNEFCIFKG
jgi:hypothetical protein